jgi:ribosomal protein S6
MTEEKDKKEYEISFLVRQEEQGQEVAKVLNRYGAQISHEGQVTKMRLAYPIKKETNACFGYYWFFAAPEAVAQIDNDLRLSKEVLRFMVVSSPVKKSASERRDVRETPKSAPQAPAPVAQERELTNEDLEKKLEEILQ